MVEKVHDYGLELEIEALRNLEVLPDAEVHAPVGQAAYNAPPSVPIIQTQNRLAELDQMRHFRQRKDWATHRRFCGLRC